MTSHFDGTSDVRRFLFTFEIVLARDLPDKDLARELIKYLNGAAFDFYHENFAPNGNLNLEGLEYNTVREVPLKTFGRQENP